MKYAHCTLIILIVCYTLGCKQKSDVLVKGTYAYDAAFVRDHTKQVIELSDQTGQAKVLLSADFQGRVMTSSASGNEGNSYGWLNYELIASNEKKKQFNPVGGEERFWLGPEGGQFSLYFHAGDSFVLKNWQVPPMIDTEAFHVVESNSTSATFSKTTSIINYSGTVFDLSIERKILLLTKEEIEFTFNETVGNGINYVGYQTINQIKNTGSQDWKKESGLLSIWLLGMFTPSEQTTVIIPFKPLPDAKDLITTSYFGEIPAERIAIQDSVLFFTCDGKLRSKIGLSPVIAKPFSASYDFKKNILTITKFEIVSNSDYVNSKWEWQQEPYRGDAVNSYNDGPLEDGSQLGPFYELESSSRALSLKAGEAALFSQVTAHFEGDFIKLNELTKHILGVDLNQIKK
jgi:hypothetical protein